MSRTRKRFWLMMMMIFIIRRSQTWVLSLTSTSSMSSRIRM